MGEPFGTVICVGLSWVFCLGHGNELAERLAGQAENGQEEDRMKR